MNKLLLGIDIGTTAAKAALYDVEGALHGVGQAEYPLYHVQPGWVEQDPQDWWQAACNAIRQALAQAADRDDGSGPSGYGGPSSAARRVAGVAVSSQAPTMLPLDAQGQPIRRALIWMDRRGEADAVALAEQVGWDEVYRISGNRPDTFYAAAKLRWFVRNEPENFARTRVFLQITGYINYRLTGVFGLDNVHAALLQLRDYRLNAWSDALCKACGVDPSLFSEVQPGHAIQGEVTREAAEATGLLPGTPVMVGTVDGSAAAVEAGAIQLGTAAEMTGTSTVLLMLNDGTVTTPDLFTMPHAVPGLSLLVGAMVASGASLRWFRDQFGGQEMQEAAQRGLDAFDLLTAQAAQVQPGSDGVIFLPYMMGERSPLWHTNARGVFFGLSLATPRGAMIRAVLEGTAFTLRHNIEVARQAGVTLNEVRSVGGGSRSALWNQIKADVLGLPVALPETSVGAPFGDAILAGIGLGLYPNVRDTLASMIKIRAHYEPNPIYHGHYADLYAVFRNIYEHLRNDFDRAAQINTMSFPS